MVMPFCGDMCRLTLMIGKCGTTFTKRNKNLTFYDEVRNQTLHNTLADPEGGQGVRTPPPPPMKNLEMQDFLAILVQIP